MARKIYSKYRAKPKTINGIRFASTKEAGRYANLKLLQRAGKICELETQPRFPLIVKGIIIATYVADFRYTDLHTLATIVEDVKGMKTPVYRLKKKLMKAIYGIDILET